ncbi:glycoside hydrolase family 172 protein [Candidatus Poribacteria bacterium]
MYNQGLLASLTRAKDARSLRASSWDTTGRNADAWRIEAGETRVLADIKGPGCINHIWMTQGRGYRDVLIRMFWDDEDNPSVLCPIGDFFGLGHEIVNSYQSLLFSASTRGNNQSNTGCALNCYVQMPFRESARIELVNEGSETHGQYFYIDYELYDKPPKDDVIYFHTQFRRENPCNGWGHEVRVNTAEANIVNAERLAWTNNYLILEAEGKGHYIGCNLSVSNFQRTWWGEGDDMIWVDGYKWPPELHGTGSEDYLNQAWGMQDNAFMRNGSSIHEGNTNGYQTSYVHHLENPVRFQKEIKVTIEHGHGNHLSNETSSAAYWYQTEPHKPFGIVPAEHRKPVQQDEDGNWIIDESVQTPPAELETNDEMRQMKEQWKAKQEEEKK